MRRTSPSPFDPARTVLVCAGDDADPATLARLAEDGERVEQLASPGTTERWNQLSSCVFTLGASSGDDTETVWDAVAMGSVPVVLSRNPWVKKLYVHTVSRARLRRACRR